MQPPTRPFESLDWYREASKRDYRARGPMASAVRWLQSSRCFAFHIGLFALGITIALAINVAQSPGNIWSGRLAIGWVMLIVIHAGVSSLFWAMGLISSDGHRVPEYPGVVTKPNPPRTTVAQPVTVAPGSPNHWPAAPPREDGTTVEPAPPTVEPADAKSPLTSWNQWGQPRSTGSTSGWPSDTVSPSAARGSESASWREASPAAWLRRRRTMDMTSGPEKSTTDLAPKPENSTGTNEDDGTGATNDSTEK